MNRHVLTTLLQSTVVLGVFLISVCVTEINAAEEQVAANSEAAKAPILPIPRAAEEDSPKDLPGEKATETNAIPSWGQVSGGYVNVRCGPGTKFGIIKTLKGGDYIRPVKWHEKWLEIRWPETAPAWISSRYVDPDGTIKGNRVRIRARGNLTCPILREANRGEKVEIVGRVSDWYKIKAPTEARAFIYGKYTVLGVRPPEGVEVDVAVAIDASKPEIDEPLAADRADEETASAEGPEAKTEEPEAAPKKVAVEDQTATNRPPELVLPDESEELTLPNLSGELAGTYTDQLPVVAEEPRKPAPVQAEPEAIEAPAVPEVVEQAAPVTPAADDKAPTVVASKATVPYAVPFESKAWGPAPAPVMPPAPAEPVARPVEPVTESPRPLPPRQVVIAPEIPEEKKPVAKAPAPKIEVEEEPAAIAPEIDSAEKLISRIPEVPSVEEKEEVASPVVPTQTLPPPVVEPKPVPEKVEQKPDTDKYGELLPPPSDVIPASQWLLSPPKKSEDTLSTEDRVEVRREGGIIPQTKEAFVSAGHAVAKTPGKIEEGATKAYDAVKPTVMKGVDSVVDASKEAGQYMSKTGKAGYQKTKQFFVGKDAVFVNGKKADDQDGLTEGTVARASGDAPNDVGYRLVKDESTAFYLQPQAGVDLEKHLGQKILVFGSFESDRADSKLKIIKVTAAIEKN